MMNMEAVTSPRRELVRAELLTKAAEVFEQKGFAQTRIEDIARALQLKRSALYYYFKTKNDVLRALVEDYVEGTAQEMDVIVAKGGTAQDKLRALLHASIQIRTSGGARVRALDNVGPEMPEEIKTDFAQARRRIFDLHVRVIRDGIAAGEFRDTDANIAAFAVLGVASWISWWYSPGGRHDPDEIARELSEITLNGLLRGPLDPQLGRTQSQILASMRRDVEDLERLNAQAPQSEDDTGKRKSRTSRRS